MNKLSFFSLFTGAGGADCGAIAAGLHPIGGVEIDPYPVELYRANFGNHIRAKSILDTPIEQLPDFDFLWASPSCTKFSASNRNAGETLEDIQVAEKIAWTIKKKLPEYFALENVRQYLYRPKNQQFTDSFARIVETLDFCGYYYSYSIENTSGYGEPQDRERLILRASKNRLNPLIPTHSHFEDFLTKRRVGWYDAIKDILPSCKDTFITNNQQKVLNAHDISELIPCGNYLLERVGYGKRGPILRRGAEQIWTIRAAHGCDEKGSFRSPATVLMRNGDIKAIDQRCLARLQSFPDWYQWGPSAGKNCKAIGNAVPALFAQRIIESIIGEK